MFRKQRQNYIQLLCVHEGVLQEIVSWPRLFFSLLSGDLYYDACQGPNCVSHTLQEIHAPLTQGRDLQDLGADIPCPNPTADFPTSSAIFIDFRTFLKHWVSLIAYCISISMWVVDVSLMTSGARHANAKTAPKWTSWQEGYFSQQGAHWFGSCIRRFCVVGEPTVGDGSNSGPLRFCWKHIHPRSTPDSNSFSVGFPRSWCVTWELREMGRLGMNWFAVFVLG